MGEENFLSVMTMSNYCGMTSKSTSIASTTKPKLFSKITLSDILKMFL
jgi:hypothetical protein